MSEKQEAREWTCWETYENLLSVWEQKYAHVHSEQVKCLKVVWMHSCIHVCMFEGLSVYVLRIKYMQEFCKKFHFFCGLRVKPASWYIYSTWTSNINSFYLVPYNHSSLLCSRDLFYSVSGGGLQGSVFG